MAERFQGQGTWTDAEFRFMPAIGAEKFWHRLGNHSVLVVEFVASMRANHSPGMRTVVTFPIGELRGDVFHASAPFYVFPSDAPNHGYFAVGGVEVRMPRTSQGVVRPSFLNWDSISSDNPLVHLGLPQGTFYNDNTESIGDVEVNISLI